MAGLLPPHGLATVNVRKAAQLDLEHEDVQALMNLARIGQAEIERSKSDGGYGAYERPGVMLTHEQTQAAYGMALRLRECL